MPAQKLRGGLSACHDRKVATPSKGTLQRDFGLSEEEAYLALQRQSFARTVYGRLDQLNLV